MYCRYNLNSHLTELLSNQIVTKGVEASTINMLELCVMIMTAYVTQIILQDRPKTLGGPVLLRGDIVTAVSLINRRRIT